MPIQVLPAQVANQIAAGEVVERPASVVRELVDNAVDAGARTVVVSLHEGGRGLIRVTDDGAGMNREDALLAFERHATSKLTTLSDLDAIATLGFRGEALPSICSVASIRLQTRTAHEDVATEVVREAGVTRSQRSIAGPVGTVVEVSRLFFNAPARQKFLKTTRSEELKIKQWLMQYVYCRPAVAFRFESDGRELFSEPARLSLLDRARALIGAGVVTFETEVNGLGVVGALAHPSEARSEARGLTLIVNGRLVADRMVLRAVKDGFGGSLKEREFPVGVVSLTIPGTEVDVNVHPQKSEVRFRNSSAVYVAVLRSIQGGLAELRRPMGVGPQRALQTAPWSAHRATGDKQFPYAPRSDTPLSQSHLSLPLRATYPTPTELTPPPSHLAEAPLQTVTDDLIPFSFRALTFRGQLFECYLLCEAGGVFYVVDMHAAHERYQFNRVRSALRTRDRAAQGLLIPVTLALSEKEQENLRARQVILEDLGFGFEFNPDGAGHVTVKEIPSILVDRNFEGALREIAMLDADEQCGIAPLEYLLDQIAARVACHASIRSGKRMTTPEVEALFALLDSSECSAACPHGRPVVVGFSEQEVEQWFGRDR